MSAGALGATNRWRCPRGLAYVVGFVGVGLIVAAYFANQQGWLNAEDWRFPAAKCARALLILASLWDGALGISRLP